MLESIRLDGAELLIVSPTSTWPLDHGNRKRIFSVCDTLKARGAIIHFLFYPSESNWHRRYPKNSEKVMQEQWDYFYKVTPSIPLYMNAKGNSHLIDEWWDRAIENEVKWLIERNHFDAMIVNKEISAIKIRCIVGFSLCCASQCRATGYLRCFRL